MSFSYLCCRYNSSYNVKNYSVTYLSFTYLKNKCSIWSIFNNEVLRVRNPIGENI